MKKILCMLLVILALGSVALSETFDVASLSDAELIELRHAIDMELSNRLPNLEKPIYGGLYVVGTDISAGKYNIRFSEQEHGIGHINIYASKEDLENGNAMQSTLIMTDARGMFVSLVEGCLLDFDYSEESYITAASMID